LLKAKFFDLRGLRARKNRRRATRETGPDADAILDRIVHNAHRINLTGHSLRRSRANKASS
jgi:DNA replication protein DnaC